MNNTLFKLLSLFLCISLLICMDSFEVLAATSKKIAQNTSKPKMIIKPKGQSKTQPKKNISLKKDKDLNLSSINIDDIVEPSADYKFSLATSSPFNPPSVLEDNKDTSEDSARGSDVLDVDFSFIKIKGIWLLDNGERRALVQGKSEQAKIVEVGSKISDGKVVSIKQDSIVVGFYVLKGDGLREYQEKVIYFKK